MKKITTVLFLLIVSAVANAAPDGKALFNKHCSACHGTEGKGGVGVPLSMPSFINSVSDEYLKRTIRVGRPGRIMPAFPKLSDAQVTAIASHVRSWTDAPMVKFDSTPVTGDKKHGQEVFLERCAQCHGADGKGMEFVAPSVADYTPALVADVLKHGKKGAIGTMPKFENLNAKQIEALGAYVTSLSK